MRPFVLPTISATNDGNDGNAVLRRCEKYSPYIQPTCNFNVIDERKNTGAQFFEDSTNVVREEIKQKITPLLVYVCRI